MGKSKKNTEKKINYNIKKEIPVAYDTEYYDYELVVDEDKSDLSDIESDIESDLSDKNDQDTVLREVEEMNNKYSFLTLKKPKNKKEKKIEVKTELKEEEYIHD